MKPSPGKIILLLLTSVFVASIIFLGARNAPEISGILLGFSLCLIAGLLAYLLILIFNPGKPQEDRRKILGIPLFVASITLLLAALSYLTLELNKNIDQLNSEITATYRKYDNLKKQVAEDNIGSLTQEIFRSINDELGANPDRSISDETISRIASYSKSLVPAGYYSIDDLSNYDPSILRGTLFMQLMQLRLDSLTLIEIKNRVSFEGADLREQDLSKMNLSGAKLRFADLSDAHLKDANLRHIDLFGAQLIRTDLSYCDISNGDLRRSNLSWADLSSSNLDKTNFDSAIMFSAKLRELESVNSSMRFIKANNAFFDQSKLLKTDFIGSSLQYTNFSQSVLDSSIFRLTVIDNIKLQGSSLKGLQIDDKNWIEGLKTRGAEGADSLEKFYVITEDSLNTDLYRLTEVQK